MTEKETPLQRDMFTGDLVDTRTRKQKKRDREREAPRQMELFSSREVAQFGVNANPTLPLSAKTRLELAMEDPRTEEEKAQDIQRSAEEQTYSMLPQERTEQPGTVTPVYRQYAEVKRQFPQAIVFFRLGDFYETFNQDAELIARELDVALTSRNVGPGQRVHMAGVPYHVAEDYVARLIGKGHHVAICDIVGTEPVDGTMPREVLRVVTSDTAKGLE